MLGSNICEAHINIESIVKEVIGREPGRVGVGCA
jgi:hypothetical protein